MPDFYRSLDAALEKLSWRFVLTAEKVPKPVTEPVKINHDKHQERPYPYRKAA